MCKGKEDDGEGRRAKAGAGNSEEGYPKNVTRQEASEDPPKSCTPH
jgi:hypothetical protein